MTKRLKRFIKQFFRHAVIGGTAFLIDYGILILLTEVAGLYYLWSATISFVVSLIFNYRFSMRYVFKRRTDISREKEFLIFLVLSVIGLLLNTLLLWIMVDHTHIHYLIAKLLATGIVTIYNFFSRKRFLEKKKGKKAKTQ